jgi:hypothetical protein
LNLLRQLDLQLALERRDFLIETLQNPVFHRWNQTVAYWLVVVVGGSWFVVGS